jgi:hypothetical protein
MHTHRFKIGDASVVVYLSRSGYRLEWHSLSSRVWSVVNLRVGWLVKEVHAEPPSYAGDDADEATLAVA